MRLANVGRLLPALFLLCWFPLSAYGQIVVGDSIPPGDVEAAQATLERNKPKAVALNPGEFEIIEPAKGVTVPLLWVPVQSKLYESYAIPANASHSIDGIRRGEKVRRLHKFLPVPYTRTVLRANLDVAGQDVITVVRNGEKPELPPVIIDSVAVTVLGVVPEPPKPPGPQPPGPQPPEPQPPTPTVGPLRVLILTESRDYSSLPSSQVQSWTAKATLDYLDSHCIKVDNQPEYRKFDQHTDFSNLSAEWQEVMNRATNKDQRHPDTKATVLPWIVITNGKTGYEGPAPVNTEALLKKLKEYGGP